MLERERLPGQHTTGRSAAFLVESYGNRTVQRLTRASRIFFEEPPPGFASHPIVEPRPMLWIARSDQRQRLAEKTKLAVETGAELHEVDADEARAMCPVVREDYAVSGVVEPNALSIDVAGLLEGFLRGFRARGGEIVTRAEVTGLERVGEAWEIACKSDRIHAGVVVNAAGAWAEVVGELAGAQPIGLQPLRRTVIIFDPPPDCDVRRWPCLIDADEDFYVNCLITQYHLAFG